MSLYNSYDRTKWLAEVLTPLPLGGVTYTAAQQQASVLSNLGLTVTQTQLNALANQATDATRYTVAGSTLALTVAANNKQEIKLGATGGSTVTLPAATGSGAVFRFLVTVLATSNSHIVKVANNTDFMVGLISGARIDSGNAVLGFAAANSGTVATNSDTITLNRTTTGSVSVGEWFEVEDVAANTWAVKGMLSATGAAFATPFSATV